nr:hypothetical protein CPGR_04968 [Mycolicibacterium komanii]
MHRTGLDDAQPGQLSALERLRFRVERRVTDRDPFFVGPPNIGPVGVGDRPSSHCASGRPLIYALVDLPTNAWRVTAAHLRDAFGQAEDQGVAVVAPLRPNPAAGSSTPARAPITPRRKPTAKPVGERSTATRLPPRSSPLPESLSIGCPPFRQGTVHISVTGTHALGRRRRRPSVAAALCFPATRITWTRTNDAPGASPRRASGSNCSRCAHSSWQPGDGLSPPSRPHPVLARTGQGSTSRSSET